MISLQSGILSKNPRGVYIWYCVDDPDESSFSFA
jgi:hypothetical protein